MQRQAERFRASWLAEANCYLPAAYDGIHTKDEEDDNRLNVLRDLALGVGVLLIERQHEGYDGCD